MIVKDQPTIFKSGIIAAVSSLQDGNMKKYNMPEEIGASADGNRQRFFDSIGITKDQTILVNISYDRDDYTRFSSVGLSDGGRGVLNTDIHVSDALMTVETGVALFLPLADCVGAVLYDPVKKVLMVSHLGRHNIEQNGAYESVQYMSAQADVDPKDMQVWLSPAAGKTNYPLFAFDGKSQQEVVLEQLEKAGVQKENIEASHVDTTIDSNYFSHSEFLKDNTKPNGRFAIVAMMP